MVHQRNDRTIELRKLAAELRDSEPDSEPTHPNFTFHVNVGDTQRNAALTDAQASAALPRPHGKWAVLGQVVRRTPAWALGVAVVVGAVAAAWWVTH